MEVPVKNIVEQVDLSHEDVLLPLLGSNSVAIYNLM